MNKDHVIALLRKQIGRRSQSETAQALGVSESFVSQVLSGGKPPTGAILDMLGLERVISYRRKK